MTLEIQHNYEQNLNNLYTQNNIFSNSERERNNDDIITIIIKNITVIISIFIFTISSIFLILSAFLLGYILSLYF